MTANDHTTPSPAEGPERLDALFRQHHDIGTGSVKTHLHRARAALATTLEDLR